MANEADRVVVELLAKVDGFDGRINQSASAFDGGMKRIEQSGARAERAVGTSLEKIGQSTRQLQQNTRVLGQQVADIGVQLSSGTSPFLILAQQGPQVANALDGAKGKLGQFAGFLSGPWGAALLAAVSILGVLASKLIKTGDSVDDLVDKLVDQTKKAREAAEAEEIYGRTLDGVTKALEENRKELDKLKGAQDTSAEAALKNAEAQRVLALEIREGTVILLERAQAAADLASIQNEAFGPLGGGSSAGANVISAERIADLETRLKKARDAVIEARKQVFEAKSLVAVEKVLATEEEKITRVYDKRIEDARKLAVAQGKVGDELTRQVDALKKARDAEIKRIRDAEAERRKTNRDVGDQTRFISPVAGGSVSGRFGENRGSRRHTGLDIAVPVGTPVKAPAGGVVIEAGTLPGYGNVVYIDHGRGTISRLAHLSQIKATKGQIVEQGDLIGLSGGARGAPGSGNSRGPHLHQEVRVSGRPVDPRKGPFNTDPGSVYEVAERAAEEELRRRQAFTSELAGLQGEEIDARQSLITSAEEIAKLELAAIEISRKKYDDNLSSLVEQGKLHADEAAQLRGINEERAKLRTELVKRREDERKFRMAESDRQRDAELASAGRDNQEDLLQGQLALAETQRERRDLERKLLDLQYQEERARLEYIIAYADRIKTQEGIAESEKKEAEAAAEIARLRLESIDQRKTNDERKSDKSTAGPLQSFFEDIPNTADEINEAFENIAAGGLATFTDSLTDAIVNFKSLKQVGLDVLKSVTAGLVKMAIQQLLLRTIGATMGSAAIATTTAQAAAAGAAWAGPAAMASLATLGANAGPAAAALASTTALATVLGAVPKKDGGWIFGPGGPRDDRVHVAASNGEYMIKARSAAKLGAGALDYINRTGELPMLRANGGPIGRGIRPNNSPAAPRGGSMGMDENALRRIEGAVERGARAQAPVNLYPTLDPAAAFLAGLNSPGGQRAFFDFVGQNSGKFNSQLRR